MADNELSILRKGARAWNSWRAKHPEVERPNLREIDLHKTSLTEANLWGADFRRAIFKGANLNKVNLFQADLRETDFHEANLQYANLSLANLRKSNLVGANLQKAILTNANLQGANLKQADLTQAEIYSAKFQGATLNGANLWKAILNGSNFSKAKFNNANLSETWLNDTKFCGANLEEANLSWSDCRSANFKGAILRGADLMSAFLVNADLSTADLSGANLDFASLIQTNLEGSLLSYAHVYGISTWDLRGKPRDQTNITITEYDKAAVTVDDLQIAQFIYLLLNRENLRSIISAITSKSVLILGRFTPERKPILEAMAQELRKYNLVPIIFDFERCTSRDFTETIKILAGMSLFVIADITNPKSAPLELQASVPDYRIPFVIIIQKGEKPFSMFGDIPKYDWVLKPVIEYSSLDQLLRNFKPAIIDRAWKKHQELQKRRSEEIEILSIDEFSKMMKNQDVIRKEK